MSTKKKAVKQIPYVLKDNWLSVIIKSQPFSLHSTHPTFSSLKKALKDKNWEKVPKLVTAAQAILSYTQGKISASEKGIMYNDKVIHDALATRIFRMLEEGKPITHMLKFVDNCYKNPIPQAADELYTWLAHCKLPITDDGCFVAYKSVRIDFTDAHTGKIDNSPGRLVMMPFSEVDKDRREACSYGFHVCSRSYLGGFHSSNGHIMKVKVNPKHVARVPFNEPNKMGVSEYEVLGEVSKGEYNQVVKNISDIKEFEATVYPISKNVKSFLATILTSPITKRLIRQKKIKSTTLKKYSYAKLERWAEKVKLGDTKTSIETARKEVMPLFELRKREGFTVNEVAQKANIPYKKLAVMEKQPDLNQEQKDQILKAIATLSGIRDISNSGLSVKVR